MTCKHCGSKVPVYVEDFRFNGMTSTVSGFCCADQQNEGVDDPLADDDYVARLVAFAEAIGVTEDIGDNLEQDAV